MPRELKPHIGIFGRRNNGKSSIINLLAGQDVAIVSEIAGTTTDPVKKSIEIPGIGPVILIDTAGIDDEGLLGEKRVQKTNEVLKIIDLGIVLITENSISNFEQDLVEQFNKNDVPFFFVHNKSDLISLEIAFKQSLVTKYKTDILAFSSIINPRTDELISLIKSHTPESAYIQNSLLGDLIKYGDVVLLITPIDIEAPEGRIILPQIQAIRDILDNDCIAIILKEREVESFLRNTKIKPRLAVTDSSIFLKADAMIPKDIPLTGFSILLARHKGPFQHYLNETPFLSKLRNGDKLLILESCTHHVSCDDIGRTKIPRWISQFSGKKLEFETVAGLGSLPDDIKNYAMVIQCGGCMITRKQIFNRLKPAIDAGIPVTNYGMTIAYIQGIYERAIEPFVKVTGKENYL
jgi:[FeFe] hydrogenase H-cluster maturation GTPase HydF